MTDTNSSRRGVTDTSSPPAPCSNEHLSHAALRPCSVIWAGPHLAHSYDVTSVSLARPPKGKDQFHSLLPKTEPGLSLTLALHGRKRSCGYEKQCHISSWLSGERVHFKVCAKVLSPNPVWCVHTSSALAVLDRLLWTGRAWKWQPTSCLPYCQGHGSVIKGMLVLSSLMNFCWHLG